MTEYALFINGVFRQVLDVIRSAQEAEPDLILYMQPYAGTVIKRLAAEPPSLDDPVSLFISTTTTLTKVSYTCDIVGWDDKTTLTGKSFDEIAEVIQKYQPTEDGIYMRGHDSGPEAKNLLRVRGMKRLSLPFSVDKLIKLSDGLSYSPHRATSGGWSYVEKPETDWLFERIYGYRKEIA